MLIYEKQAQLNRFFLTQDKPWLALYWNFAVICAIFAAHKFMQLHPQVQTRQIQNNLFAELNKFDLNIIWMYFCFATKDLSW